MRRSSHRGDSPLSSSLVGHIPGDVQVGVVTPKGTPVAILVGYVASASPPASAKAEMRFR